MKRASKATHEQLKEHNTHLLLRAIFSGQADNRAALAQQTGLAKPTVSELVGNLMDLGLLAEEGHGQSTESGGKRPRLLRFVPAARQVIGISVDTYQVSGVLANLDGQVVARHYADLNGRQHDEAVTVLIEVINGLVAQLDAPLLCIGMGVPGAVANDAGIVRESAHLGWRDLPLGDTLARHFGVPVYVANSTELAAIAYYSFSADETVNNLVTILINHNIEMGMTVGSAVYHHGSDIGCLQITSASGESRLLEDVFTLPSVRSRAVQLARARTTQLLLETLTYLDVRAGEQLGDPIARALYDELSADLAQVCAWAIALLRPDHLALAGPVVDLGEPLVERVRARVASILQSESAGSVTFALVDSASLSAMGAAANALQQELGIL